MSSPTGTSPTIIKSHSDTLDLKDKSKTVETSIPKPEIYLTFDDGPYPSTEKILEILKTNGVRAAFFLCSRSNKIGRELQYKTVKKIIEDQHILASHGDDHDPASRAEYKKNPDDSPLDFRENRADFEALFKEHNDIFPGFKAARLPGDGRFLKEIVEKVVKQEKLPHFGWHLEFAPNKLFKHVKEADWQGISGVSASQKKIPHSQCIVLLHDSHWKDNKLDGLKALIQKLKELAKISPLPTTPPPNASKVFLSQYTAP